MCYLFYKPPTSYNNIDMTDNVKRWERTEAAVKYQTTQTKTFVIGGPNKRALSALS